MSEWKKVKFCSLFAIPSKNGLTKPSRVRGKGNKMINMGELFANGRIYDIPMDLVPLNESEKCKNQVLPDDLLFARQSLVLEGAGKCSIVMQTSEMTVFESHLIRIRLNKEDAYPLFYYYYFNSPYNPVKTIVSQCAQAGIRASDLSELQVVHPSLPTQHRIATILSRYDTLIENYQKQIKLLEEAAQRLYKEWFVELRFPGHENTKMVDGLPEGWERKRLVDFAKVTMGQSPKSEFYNNERNGLPFHQGVGSFGNRFVVDETYSTSYTRIAEPNSVLFSVRAPVGRLNITKNKTVIGRGLAAMNHVDGCQSFLFYLLKERFFKDNIIGNGAIFASISKDELLNLKFMIPTDELTYKFNDIAGNIDDAIMKTDNQIRLLAEARDRLLPRLMGGEIIM